MIGGEIVSKKKIKEMKMPNYSIEEEKGNMWSHIIGVLIGISSLIFFLIFGIQKGIEGYQVVSLVIYSLSMIVLYGASSLYHGLNKKSYKKKVMRIIDHCTVFILIAGTYTPISVIGLPSNIMLIILLIEWIGAFIGIALNIYDLSNKAFLIISMVLYLVMGWAIIVVPNIKDILPSQSFIWILLGGISYTLGTIFYGLGHNKKWFHTIFHVFCIVATILQEVGIIIMLLNL